MDFESPKQRTGDPFDAGQRAVLEDIALGAPLHQVLDRLMRLIESLSAGMLCSVVLIDETNRIRHVSAPNLPGDFVRAIEGCEIGPHAGSCGTAAYTRQRVIVDDIQTHPLWAEYRDIALPHGLRACWSTPILGPNGEVLGTFAMYYREVRTPTAQDLEWTDVAAHLASIAILRDRARDAEKQRHRMQEDVRVGEHLRSVILDSVQDAIFYIDTQGEGLYRFVSVNRAFVELFSVSEEEITGKMLHDLLPPERWAFVRERYVTASRTGKRQTWDEIMPARTGQKYGGITLTPIFDAEGRCTNFVGSVHDLTDRVQAESERVQLQAQLHQAQRMQALGTLAGGIAHDFNNILAAIGGNTSLLLDDVPQDSSLRGPLVEIQKASRRAVDLVRQILTFSRSSPVVYEVIDPRGVAIEALKLLRVMFSSKIDIETEIAPDTPRIRADSTQFHQVIMNLGTNAAFALQERGTINVSLMRVAARDIPSGLLPTQASPSYLHLRVTDRGCGMDAKTLERIFEPFFTTRTPGQGTGLGLSVVHGIVESHGGAIKVDSAIGRGTTVDVYLPASEAPAPAPVSSTPTRGHGEHVLYVDDEEALVLLMDRALTKMGYRISGYCDPMMALQEFRNRAQEFDVVVTDLAMPGMAGPDLATELRRIRPDVPIILTSGYIRPEDRAEAERLQIQQLVYKESTIDRLADVLAKEIARASKAKSGQETQ